MKRIIFYLSFAVVLVTAGSCNKSKLELKNKSAFTYDTYFASDDVLNQAVIATYATLLHQGLWSREYYYIFDLLGYEARGDAPLQGGLLAIGQYKFDADLAELSQYWASLYRLVFRANVVIDRATAWQPEATTDQANKKQYIAEAKFLKAYANFNLVTCYRKVPLRTSYATTLTDIYPSRAAVADVWAAIEQDLTEAIADLPVSYSSTNLGRATKGAAIALLGKAYLYEKKWAQAQTEFTLLSQPPFTYSLATNYADLFSTQNQNNSETIFQVMNQEWTDAGVGNQYYMFGGQEYWGQKATHSGRAQEYGFNDWKNVFITTSAVKAFTYPNSTGGAAYVDPRAKLTFYGDAASGGQTQYCQSCAGGAIPFSFTGSNGGYRWLKYEYYDKTASYGGPHSGINGQVIRYADVQLMLAEAYIQQGVTSSAPLDLINNVRNRVGAVPYTSLDDQANAMKILMRERQLELCGEQSRYFDLIRWGIAKETINAEKNIEEATQAANPFKDKNVLMPIPVDEKSTNPNLAKYIQGDWN